MDREDITIFDQEYGEMVFQDLGGDMTFSCPISLGVSKKQVEVFFRVKSRHGRPSNMQREFLRNVVSQFDKVLDSIFRKLPNDLSSLTRHELASKFQLQTIGVPFVEEGQIDWDISFVSLENAKVTLLVSMRNWEAISSDIDIDSRSWFTRYVLKLLTGD